MQYVYTNSNGDEVSLRIDRVEAAVTYFVESRDEVVIPAQQVYEDLVNEMSMGGCHFGTAHEVITDRYMREHENVSWEKITLAMRKKLVAYLEELRSDCGGDEDDPFFNDGKPWVLEDIYI